ncbi:MAG TPA: YbaK/EbsC family protein [Pirellulales bacterium]|jgi:Ala-tRNA(Pro) deacylase|nr:YbaK/EbsC family protein [Pirellulales bacterium]
MKVQEYLHDREVKFDVLPHEDTFDSQHLAEAVHVSGRQVAKTVLLRMDHGYKYAVAILPATHLIDLDSISQLLGGAKVELATEYEIGQRCPDCEMGVLPPFGSIYGLETVLDESLREAEQIVFEANTHQEAIRMAGEDFMRLESPLAGAFARPRTKVDVRSSKPK